jgi:tRNA wybutosine-synthesizing protein 2
MSFKDQLKEKLRDKIKEDMLDLLPSGFQNIGEIIIINLNPKLKKHKKIIGEAVLEIFPRIKTVCNKKGIISGKFRIPKIEIIAGEKSSEAVTQEYGCFYKFDVKKIMFAKGNINERVRIAKQIKPGETVLDMFAGIGYFTVPIAKLGKPKQIYSIELNPISFKYLNENLKLNKIQEKVITLNGDCSKETPKLVKKFGRFADRIVMGYLPPPKKFIKFAMAAIKKGGIIHYETIMYEDKLKEETQENLELLKKEAKKQNLDVKLLSVNYVKGYRPKVNHYVLDIQII